MFSIVTVWRALKQMGFTKKKSLQAIEQLRDDVQDRRKRWHRRMKQVDPGASGAPGRRLF